MSYCCVWTSTLISWISPSDMGDRFTNSNGLPMASEDSEEFLTILGKKMGKLVKGGDAEPWRNDVLLCLSFFCAKALITDSVACDDWTCVSDYLVYLVRLVEFQQISTHFKACHMCVVRFVFVFFRTSTPRLASSSTTGSAGASRTSPRRRSCRRPKRTRAALAERRHHLRRGQGPQDLQGTFQRKQRSRRFRASTSSMRRTKKGTKVVSKVDLDQFDHQFDLFLLWICLIWSYLVCEHKVQCRILVRLTWTLT